MAGLRKRSSVLIEVQIVASKSLRRIALCILLGVWIYFEVDQAISTFTIQNGRKVVVVHQVIGCRISPYFCCQSRTLIQLLEDLRHADLRLSRSLCSMLWSLGFSLG